MNVKQAIKWVLYYRTLSTLSFVLGVGLVAAGFYLGLQETITILLADFPKNVDGAVAAANPALTVGLGVLGVGVWQFGKTLALVKTMEKTAVASDDGVDRETVERQISDLVDERVDAALADASEDDDHPREGEPTRQVVSAAGAREVGGGDVESPSASTTDATAEEATATDGDDVGPDTADPEGTPTASGRYADGGDDGAATTARDGSDADRSTSLGPGGADAGADIGDDRDPLASGDDGDDSAEWDPNEY